MSPVQEEQTWPITVVTAPGLQTALAEEIRGLVGARVSDRPFGVSLDATTEQAYRIVCDSLIAGHVYLGIVSGRADDADGLYRLGQSIDWTRLFPVDAGFSITATGTSESLRHTGFIVTRLKDAIVDQFRDRTGNRPSVDTDAPDMRIHCHLTQAGFANISIELSNGSLHRRGYRTEGGLAPLRENLAAAILWRSRWPEIGAQGGALFDPMCGSGTLLIEAALRAYGQPEWMRQARIGSLAWLGHDHSAQQSVLDTPVAPCASDATQADIKICGRDIDPTQIAAAQANVRRAGLDDRIELSVADAWSTPCPDSLNGLKEGLLISNLPYGNRIPGPGTTQELRQRWSSLVDRWQGCFAGWSWAMLMPEGQATDWPLRYEKAFDFDNGGTPVQLLRGVIDPAQRRETPGPRGLAARLLAQARKVENPNVENPSADDQSFANRLRKNWKHISKVAQRQGWTCFRVYDADLPEFNLAIDHYRDEDGERWIDIQEYQAPGRIDPQLARQRLATAVLRVQEQLDVADDHLLVRQRRRQSGSGQYGRMAQEHIRKIVHEGDARLWVNLTDYLDTGLFLDHRLVRDRVAALAEGKSLLNLFCYTASASVRAAVAGARTTVSVDLSNTYLDWAAENFELNGIEASREDRRAGHRLLRADVLEWLATASARPEARTGFDVIFCDPPSFSNSKTMRDVLDIQRDHERIVRQCMRLLKPDGRLVFSNNLRGFKLATYLQKDFHIDDISRKTLPEDFSRTPNRRSVFEISAK